MFKRFWAYFGPYKKYLVISSVCVVLEGTFELVIPLIMADIIDVGVAARDTGYILGKGLQMVLCALVSLALGAVYARLAALAGQGFGAELRRAEYQKVQSFSFSNIDRFSTSSLVTRLTSDVAVLQNAVCNGIRPLVRGPVMMVTALTMSILLNAQLALIFAVAIPLLAAALFLILAVIWPNSIMASLAGIFAGAMLIRFSVTRYQGERGMQVFDKLAMAGGIVLILLAAARLVLMGLIAAGVLERGVLPFPYL